MSKAPTKTAPKQGTADLEARLATLRSEVDEIMAVLAEKAGDAGDQLAEDAVKSAETKAEDISEEILKDARRALKQIRKQAATLEKTLGVETSINPVQGLLLAFGAGFIASLLIRR